MPADALAPVIVKYDTDHVADILQTTFSNAFSWMKIYEIQLIFYWILSN